MALPKIPNFAINKAIGLLPRLYIDNPNILPTTDASGQHHINVKRLRQHYGIHSGPIREVRKIVDSSKWHICWLVLIAEAHGWFIIRNIYWRKKSSKKNTNITFLLILLCSYLMLI